MTIIRRVSLATTVVYPERATDTDYQFEPAIIVRRNASDGSVTLAGVSGEIHVPEYALADLIKVLRSAQKEA
jgi:glutamine amidotransferase-like uncharacterized protein